MACDLIGALAPHGEEALAVCVAGAETVRRFACKSRKPRGSFMVSRLAARSRATEIMVDSGLYWVLLYTKPRAESWAEINLRRQGFPTLLPRVSARGAYVPLFPRYLFVACREDQRIEPLRNTRGVHSIVFCGDHPARVPHEVILEVRERMNMHGVVTVDSPAPIDPLFARAERERVRTLIKLAQAGFRVVA